jgi:hypothetical protein
MSGHDGDSCRANQLSDGRVLCITCGSYITPFDAQVNAVYRMPFAIRTFVATMLREREIHAPSLKLTMASFGPNGTSEQASAACAQGNEGVILNSGYLIFSAAPYGLAKLEVRFQADELQSVPEDFSRTSTREPGPQQLQFLQNLSLNSCPPALVAAIGRLIAIGFEVRHLDYTGASMRRIQLHCGGLISGTSTPKGIIVEATYLV